mmetsp:Transcript_66943/g.148595  ORF Transcript_66943/g.148595 Transcript_66943/m.148595 type:complete len:165 (+) Transcript_66943:1323-1817(+)
MANVSGHDAVLWLESTAVGLAQDLILVPLGAAFVLGTLASIAICCSRSVKDKIAIDNSTDEDTRLESVRADVSPAELMDLRHVAADALLTAAQDGSLAQILMQGNVSDRLRAAGTPSAEDASLQPPAVLPGLCVPDEDTAPKSPVPVLLVEAKSSLTATRVWEY